MSDIDPVTDVVELCAILQCLGFAVKSLDTSDSNQSQDGGVRTIVINCQSSGLHVVLESSSVACSCPVAEQQNSGFWQVSGITGGRQHDQETGSTLLRTLPKDYRDRFTADLRSMVASIRALSDDEPQSAINKSASMVELGHHSGSLVELNQEGNKSASVLELGTPEKRHKLLKVETPTRYRSLDTLTSAENKQPPLGNLQNQYTTDRKDVTKNFSSHRQSTYTICSTPGSMRSRNKTSSPINMPQHNLLDRLLEAEKAAESLRNKLAVAIKEYVEEGKNDSSMGSMLDVSKISVLKTEATQFASSPNLSGMGAPREDQPQSRLKRFSNSASTSNLGPKKLQVDKDKDTKRRISPNIFKLKMGSSNAETGKSKLQSLFKPKIVTPVRVPKLKSESSPNLSSTTKKKFSHVKSTIPRPMPKKE